jgi:hypothetical protein
MHTSMQYPYRFEWFYFYLLQQCLSSNSAHCIYQYKARVLTPLPQMPGSALSLHSCLQRPVFIFLCDALFLSGSPENVKGRIWTAMAWWCQINYRPVIQQGAWGSANHGPSSVGGVGNVIYSIIFVFPTDDHTRIVSSSINGINTTILYYSSLY